jgi:hypothetical protein
MALCFPSSTLQKPRFLGHRVSKISFSEIRIQRILQLRHLTNTIHVRSLPDRKVTGINMPSKSVTDLWQDFVDHIHLHRALSEETFHPQDDPEDIQAVLSTAADPLDNYRSYAI